MDDHAAIEKCRAGDNEAFRQIVEHYQAEAIGHATAILGNHEDALDAVQEAFINAFQALDQLNATIAASPEATAGGSSRVTPTKKGRWQLLHS